MRIRRKKNLEDRLSAANGYLLRADTDILDAREARQNKDILNFEQIFGNANPVSLEIGCGKGGFIIEVAKRNPAKNFLAVELLDNIIVMAAESAQKEGVKNLRFFTCGADYLSRYIKEGSIERIFLNFSPPYNGSRYENRRLTKDSLVADYKDFLKCGGEVFQKTDDKIFFDYSFLQFEKHGYSVTDVSEDINCGNIENVQSEYERKFRNSGVSVYALIAKKSDVL